MEFIFSQCFSLLVTVGFISCHCQDTRREVSREEGISIESTKSSSTFAGDELVVHALIALVALAEVLNSQLRHSYWRQDYQVQV